MPSNYGYCILCINWYSVLIVQIATWNVNSIRARVDLVAAWLADQCPDVCCLQETKCTDDDFPFETFEEIGYQVAHHGLSHWNGVAIMSRVGLRKIFRGFHGHQEEPFNEARSISAECGGVRVWSIYAPNGRALDDPHYLFKLVWLERLRGDLIATRAAKSSTVVVGDFNVAPSDLDIYDPRRWKSRTHASAPERAAIEALLELGFFDLAREWDGEDPFYTWWNYRSKLDDDKGLRIDLALGSEEVFQRIKAVSVDRMARRAERPSDHAPLIVELY